MLTTLALAVSLSAPVPVPAPPDTLGPRAGSLFAEVQAIPASVDLARAFRPSASGVALLTPVTWDVAPVARRSPRRSGSCSAIGRVRSQARRGGDRAPEVGHPSRVQIRTAPQGLTEPATWTGNPP